MNAVTFWYEALDIIVTLRDGATKFTGHIRHNYESQVWQVYDYAAAAWVDFLTYITYEGLYTDFHTFKLVLDADTGKYHTFRHCAGLVDLSAYSMDSEADANVPLFALRYKLVSEPDSNDYGHVDQIIFTQDES